MKKSTETFIELCDTLCVQPYYTSAGNIIGVDPKTIFRWIQQSQLKPKEFTFTWADAEAPLHVHIRSAMRLNAHMIKSQARKFALDGWEEPIFFQGRPQWKEREDCAGMSDDDCKIFSPTGDRWERDANGNRVQLTVRHKPSDALILKVLSAAFPTVYGQNQTVEVRHGGTVKVLAYSRDSKPAQEMKTIEHVPAERRLEAIRERMRAEAETHLSNPNRVTQPCGPVQKFAAKDVEVHDKPNGPRYAGPAPAGVGAERTGIGPDPRNPDGKATGFRRA